MTPLVVDLFAGAGGVDLGLRQLGFDPIGIEYNPAACATRAAAGLRTIRADLNTWLPGPNARIDGLWASPPCQDFSVAGKSLGRTGPRGRLVDIPPLWVDLYRPRWVVCEEVPNVLPIWHEHADYYRTLGYRTWTGTLNAADYGLPQSRERAFLLASLDMQPVPPTPTHDRTPHPSLFGEPLKPWVTIAQALGWHPELLDLGPLRIAGTYANNLDGRTRAAWVFTRPSPTVTGSGCISSPSGFMSVRINGYETGLIVHQCKNPVDLTSWPCEPYAPVPSATDLPYFHKLADEHQQPGPLMLSLEHVLVLQGFPVGYPVQGNKSARFLQVGNAVPPPIAAAVCRQLVQTHSPIPVSTVDPEPAYVVDDDGQLALFASV
jgi:DNA (cytosine-5)-methyltransferase 1